MTMKKRFLGLALAAMVAVPATTAYAAGDVKSIVLDENNSTTHTIDVQGMVRGNDGSLPAGRIEVVVPTTMEFTVDQNGKFLAADNYEVENKSADKTVKVQVASFAETNPSSGIEVKSTINGESDKRSSVKLSLLGNAAGSGVNLVHGQIKTPQDLLTVDPNGVSTIVLEGEAGKQPLDGNAPNEGISEKFTVTFKISAEA